MHSCIRKKMYTYVIQFIISFNIFITKLLIIAAATTSINVLTLTSIGEKITESPNSLAISCPFEVGKSAITTLAPCFMNLCTVPRPKPEAPPVTRATNP